MTTLSQLLRSSRRPFLRAMDKAPSILAFFFALSFAIAPSSAQGHPGGLPFIEALANLSIGTADTLGEGLLFTFEELPDTTPGPGSTYDFIVVGAGSAGATVASRLSELPDVSVLLIEAGGSENLVQDVPLFVQYLQFDTGENWKYRTEPSDYYCAGLEDKRCNWPRGRVMGGSSVLNYMIATRGNRRDYDGWAEMGSVGWSYEEVLPYFKKLENINIPELKVDAEQHGTSGPVNVTYAPYRTPLAEAFVEAGRELGFDVVDYNGRTQTGFSFLQTTTVNGRRVSTNRAYLHPKRSRKNLFVAKNSLVGKVLIDPRSRRAFGVSFAKNNRVTEVMARREVILSAGAIGSPQLLMLSGVGPAQHLFEIGINVIQDSPVGRNLMDHIAYGGLVFLVNDSVSIVANRVANAFNPHIKDYLNERSGPLTVPGGCEALGFINLENPFDPDGYPDVELLFAGASVLSEPLVHRIFGIPESLWDETYRRYSQRDSWTVLPMLMRPKSKGVILLRDKDINSHPRIVPNYLSDPEDVRVAVEGIRAAIRVSETLAMQRFGSTLLDPSLPGCSGFEYRSDQYWECAVRSLPFTIYHQSGTCKMGPRGDPSAVVDPRLKVIGVEGLRVADASVMPEIPAAHTNIPVIMIAEKLADMVKQDWGYSIETIN